MPLVKVKFKHTFEFGGQISDGVAVHAGVDMQIVGDCQDNPHAYVQFTLGGGVQLLVDNKISSISISEGVPADYIELHPITE